MLISIIGNPLKYGDLISVVMPVYNRAHLVARVVGSLCAQTYRNLEILIVDDCSTDDIEGAIVALNDPRVRLVRRARNGGVAAARNTGVAAATADWIAFHDSDDFCTADRFDLSVRAMEQLPADYIGVYGARLIYTEVDEAGYGAQKLYMRPFPHQTPLSGDISARTVTGNIINFPTLLVRKSALLVAGPSDELLRKNVDWDLCLRLTRQGKFGFVPEPLVLTPTSLDPAVSSARVSRSVRQGARSYVRITGKIRRAGYVGPALAAHYATTARYLLRLGRPRLARRFMRAALVLDMVKPKLWLHYVFSFAPGLHAKLRQHKV
jgi:glycosyltransferase involved in cell wall biosynthesis